MPKVGNISNSQKTDTCELENIIKIRNKQWITTNSIEKKHKNNWMLFFT